MSEELKYLGALVARGKLDRRAFLGRAAALGASAFAPAILANAALAAGPVKGGTMRVGLGGGQATDTLDPALAASEGPNTLLAQFGEKLFEVDPAGAIVPRLATEFHSSKDAKVWTFKLRDGVTFHNGKPVTANDVVETMKRHADAKSKSAALGLMAGITKMSASGNEFVAELKDPNADFPYIMADYHLIIQPDGGRANPADGIAAGPYKVVKQEAGVHYVFEKYAGYWDDSRGHANTIDVKIINDDTARMSAIQSAQVDMINRVAPKVAALLGRAKTVAVKSVPSRGHYVLVMRATAKPFDNNDLRLALKYAIDRKTLLDKVLFGHGTLGNDIPINKFYPLFSDDIEQRQYDPDKAKFHFKKSGHEGPILLDTSDVAFPGAVDACQLFQQSAAAAGIDIQIKRDPGDGYWTEVWNNKPFCASYWNGRPTQDMVYSTIYTTGAAWNESAYSNPEFDSTVVLARGELDTEKRKQLYRKLAMMIRDEGGTIVPMFSNFVDAIGQHVAGWADDPSAPLMNALAPVKCWLANA